MTGQNHNGWPVLLYEYGTVVGALMPALTLVLVWSVVIKVGVEWVDQDHLRHKAPGGRKEGEVVQNSSTWMTWSQTLSEAATDP